MKTAKRTLALFAALFLFNTNISFSESGWFNLSSGVNTFLWDISFADINTGYMCTDGGKVIKTTNAGANWTVLNTFASQNLLCISFVNANTGFTAGGSGIIFKTTNGGVNWIQSTSPSTNSFQCIRMIDAGTGFVGGGSPGLCEIYKTTNGGINWNQYGPPLFLAAAMDFSFPSPDTGYAAIYNGVIVKTTNAGLNWTVQNTGLTSSSPLFSVYFVDDNYGFASSSDGKIIKTTNGGTNWNIIYTSTYAIVGLSFPSQLTGYACGGNFTTEVVFRTTNGGVNWISETLPLSGHANSIFFTSVLEGYISCENGVIYKTTNGGNPIGIQPVSNEIPSLFKLEQNYPNPFNPATNIEFELPKNTNVKLYVYNTLGETVNVLINEELRTGKYRYEFNGSSLASGVYFYRIETSEFTQTKKLILLK